MKRIRRFLSQFFVSSLLFALFFSLTGTTQASHSWGNYHWARTGNPFTISLGDNVSSSWDSFLATASGDWNVSSVLNTSVVAGGTSAKRCRPTNGRIEVCSERYGKNGWLGLAQIWASGSHITQAITKVNDSYFNTASYNTPAWKNLVMCQEIGHDFGLDHQDEDFNNPPLGTCMDYTSDPTPNQHPNAHDYAQLESIYAHFDSFTTISQLVGVRGYFEENFENPRTWGKKVRGSAQSAVYERDFGFGQKMFTFIIFADPSALERTE